MTSLIYYGLTLIRFYGQRGRSRISIKLDSHTLLALFSCPPLVFGVGLKKSKMFFSPQWPLSVGKFPMVYTSKRETHGFTFLETMNELA